MRKMNDGRAELADYIDKIADCYRQGIAAKKAYVKRSAAMPIMQNGEERIVAQVDEKKRQKELDRMNDIYTGNAERLVQEYTQKEADFFALDGKKVTADKELLTMALTAEQVADLQGRYRQNATMLQQVNQYASSHGMPTRELQSAADRADLLRTFNRLMKPRFLENGVLDGGTPTLDFEECASAYGEMKCEELR